MKLVREAPKQSWDSVSAISKKATYKIPSA
jgi:hypothetical protein